MRRRFDVPVLAALLVFLAALPATAQSPPRGAVLLPVCLQGTYQPVRGSDFTDRLLSALGSAGLGHETARISEESLRSAGLTTPERPPSPAVADGLCDQARKRFCVWISLRMDATMGARGDHLAISAASRFWAWDSVTDTVVLDAPLGSVHSQPLSARPDAAALQKATVELVEQNIEDLALQVLTLTQQEAAGRRVQAWQTRQPQPPARPSTAVKAMTQACQDYARAVSRSDLVATQDALKRAYTAWPQLTAQEQRGVEEDYPGTYDWMNRGNWYGGDYYHPPYWRP